MISCEVSGDRSFDGGPHTCSQRSYLDHQLFGWILFRANRWMISVQVYFISVRLSNIMPRGIHTHTHTRNFRSFQCGIQRRGKESKSHKSMEGESRKFIEYLSKLNIGNVTPNFNDIYEKKTKTTRIEKREQMTTTSNIENVTFQEASFW